MPYLYKLSGLVISSPLAFPGVAICDSSEEAVDITISLGRLPGGLPATERFYERVASDSFLISVPHIAHYLIHAGREILIEPCKGAEELDIYSFLSGLAFWAIYQQRGLLPLHASAVQVGQRGVAFAGPSGAGKSTLAAVLVQRGYPLVSDDACAIAIDRAGRVIAYPGFPRLKLWLNSLEILQQPSESLVRCHSRLDKYYLPVAMQCALEPLPLEQIYLLRESAELLVDPIERLQGLDAVVALVDNTQRPALIAGLGLAAQHFKQCATLASLVPVYRFARPLGVEYMDRLVTALEAHWKGEPCPSRGSSGACHLSLNNVV